MEKPEPVDELEAFPAIYKKIRKETFRPYEKHIREPRLKRLPLFDRIVVGHTLFCMFTTFALGAFVAFLGHYILISLNRPNRADAFAMLSVLGIQAMILVILWRVASFKGSPTGEYRFYLEAKRLIKAYRDKGYSVESLRISLKGFVRDMNAGIAVFASSAAAIALYQGIDSNGFKGASKPLDKFMEFLAPFPHGLSSRWFFALLFAVCFLFTLFKFYFPRVWAEQVQDYVEHILDKETPWFLRNQD